MSDPRRGADGNSLEVRLTLEGMPEALAGIRGELARLIRETADDEPPAVAARLRKIADDFEAGVSSE